MIKMPNDSHLKFDPSRAGEYETQSRVALAGYNACHELAVCLLAASIGRNRRARVLVAGAGGGAREIVTAGMLEPEWQFTAVDPSEPMMDITRTRLIEHGLFDSTQIHLDYTDDLPVQALFDAATLIGVLHHLPGAEAKQSILHALAVRVKPGAPLIVACNHYRYASQPLLLAAWAERWRMQGASHEEVQAKLAKILQGADPPESEQAVIDLLTASGFKRPVKFFSSLFWGAWIAFRQE